MDIFALLPVSGIVVRCRNAADLKSRIASCILSFGIKVNPQLVVEPLKQRFVRHACLEQRDIDSRHFLDGRLKNERITAERNESEGIHTESLSSVEKGILYRYLALDGEHEMLPVEIQLIEFFRFDPRIAFLDLGGSR